MHPNETPQDVFAGIFYPAHKRNQAVFVTMRGARDACFHVLEAARGML